MSTVTKYPHIETPEGGPARLARLPRIRVAQIIMDHIAHGWSAEEICRQHSHLTPAEVHAAFAYYFDNRDALDREIEKEWRDADETAKSPHASPFFIRMKAKGLL
jgi:uncharacterized protein (DUF433 family)